MQKPLVNKKYKLEKFPGKGGWTYAAIPEILQDKQAPFGWVKVKGFIDDVEIKSYHLMPMGNGKLFLPVKAAIRKKIKKEAGDWIQVVLFPDDDPLYIPEDLLECLRDEPEAHKQFFRLTDGGKKQCIDWIYSAKQDATRTQRMSATIDRLLKGLPFGKDQF